MSEHLPHLARRVADDPWFLAYALARYQAAQGLDEAALALALHVAVGDLDRLRLCRQPKPDRWQQDINQISAGVGCDGELLALIARDYV